MSDNLLPHHQQIKMELVEQKKNAKRSFLNSFSDFVFVFLTSLCGLSDFFKVNPRNFHLGCFYSCHHYFFVPWYFFRNCSWMQDPFNLIVAVATFCIICTRKKWRCGNHMCSHQSTITADPMCIMWMLSSTGYPNCQQNFWIFLEDSPSSHAGFLKVKPVLSVGAFEFALFVQELHWASTICNGNFNLFFNSNVAT